MPCRVAICDDDKNQLNSLQSVIEKWGRISGSPCEVSVFPSAEAFLFAYEEDKHWDILLLDVEMEGMSGMGLARRVRQDNLRAEIIFVTSHFEFVSEGYEVDALHYLTKPVPEDKLMEVLDKAGERLAAEPPSQVITCEGETVKLYERAPGGLGGGLQIHLDLLADGLPLILEAAVRRPIRPTHRNFSGHGAGRSGFAAL